MLREMRRNINLAFFNMGIGACSYYRLALPMLFLQEKGNYSIKAIERGDTADIVEMAIESSDIIVTQLAGAKEDAIGCVTDCEEIKRRGKKLVIDYDDHVFDVSPLSPIYNEWGIEEVEWDGKPLWIDGHNGFDIQRNLKRHEDMKSCIAMADMITTTQPVVADLYRQYNDNVVTLPNCVDMNIWKRPQFVDDGQIRLYWSGGDGHYQDFYILRNVIPEIMNKYPETRLVLFGAYYKGCLKGIPEDRIDHLRWQDFTCYPYVTMLQNADISLIPLEDNEFNRCKSALKFIEQSAMGVPSVMSKVTPYKEVYERNNAVLVSNDDDSWYKGISLLIEDRTLAKHIGHNAKDTVRNKFDINNQWHQWEKAYGSLL